MAVLGHKTIADRAAYPLPRRSRVSVQSHRFLRMRGLRLKSLLRVSVSGSRVDTRSHKLRLGRRGATRQVALTAIAGGTTLPQKDKPRNTHYATRLRSRAAYAKTSSRHQQHLRHIPRRVDQAVEPAPAVGEGRFDDPGVEAQSAAGQALEGRRRSWRACRRSSRARTISRRMMSAAGMALVSSCRPVRMHCAARARGADAGRAGGRRRPRRRPPRAHPARPWRPAPPGPRWLCAGRWARRPARRPSPAAPGPDRR